MKKETKKILSFSFVGIFLLAVVFFAANLFVLNKKNVYSKQSFEADRSATFYATGFIDKFLANESKNLTNKALINKYCDLVVSGISESEKSAFVHNGFAYDPRYSLFVSYLCEFTKPSDKPKYVSELLTDKYLKETELDFEFYQLGGADGESLENICEEGDLEDCPIVDYFSSLEIGLMNSEFDEFGYGVKNRGALVHTIFNDVISEYFDLMQTTLYDFSSIEEFSKKTFGTTICGDKGYFQGAEFCEHPKTKKYLEDMVESSENIMKNIELLDYDKIKKSGDKNFLVCSFRECNKDDVEESAKNVLGNRMKSFKNLVLNELMWYNLFLSYYKSALLNGLKGTNSGGGSLSDLYSSSQLEATRANSATKSIGISQRAISSAFVSLNNLYFAYPIHVGLLAYYEDIIKFRSSMKKVYTPLHQLHFKLMNVQSAY